MNVSSLIANPILTAMRAACVLAAVAATSVLSAAQLEFWGVLTKTGPSYVDPETGTPGSSFYNVGDPWRMTLVFPDPLTPSMAIPAMHVFVYSPSSVTTTVDGNTVSSYSGPKSVNGLVGTLYYGIPVWANGVSAKSTSPNHIYLDIGSMTNHVTGPNGMLLPLGGDITMASFDRVLMDYVDDHGAAAGVITGYSMPDGGATAAMFGMALALLALVRQRLMGTPRRA